MKNPQSTIRNPQSAIGFTLVELLVVVAIIALLVSILLPSLSRAKELAKRVICAGNLRGIGLTVYFYANDHNEWLPPAFPADQYDQYERYWFYCGTLGFKNIGLLAKVGLLDHQSGIFICPSMRSEILMNSRGNTNHQNCVPGPPPRNLRLRDPEDIGLGWTHGRSYYRRGYDADDKLIETLDDLGGQAWLADCFSHPGHVRESHADGVNVWYGDGHAEYNIISNIDELWENRSIIVYYGDDDYYKNYWAGFDK